MQNTKTILKTVLVLGLIVVTLLILVFTNYTSAPSNSPVEITFTIEKGSTLKEVAQDLKSQNLIKSAKALQIIALLKDRNFKVISGAYRFDGPNSFFEILDRINGGEYGDVYIRATIPEGSTNLQMAEILGQAKLENFDKEEFIKLAKDKEGYLFPDTYFLLPDADAESIVQILEENFKSKLELLQDKLSLSPRTLEEVIIMASLVEKEANTTSNNDDEARKVAGILWKRIEIDMALQVDAPFLYLLNKASSELTRSDLAIDSPFNTYLYKGLPPFPIGNPGLNAISATLDPIETSFLFYLHDNDGNIHYAETHSGHIKNKNKYLK